MDFRSLTRRELQSLCKLNKIPANITNVAMADALQSLTIVEGLEELKKASGLAESAETIELPSPKAPLTRCRTSTRQKVKKTESENLARTVTRTTRRAVKQLAGGDIKDVLKNQPHELLEQSLLVDQKMEPVPSSPATTLKPESTVLEMETLSRPSPMLTEKKSVEAVKIKSFLEEVDVESEENVSTVESGAQVEDICNAFEKLDVLPVVANIDQFPVLETVVDEESAHKSEEEIEDCGGLDSLMEESEEALNPCEENDSIEAENDDVEENLEQKLDLEDEKFDASEVKLVIPESNGSSTMVSDIENPIESLNENNFGETVNETVVDNVSTMIEEARDLIYIENKVDKKEDADQFSVLSVPCLPVENHDVIGKPTPMKNMGIISNDKENIHSERKVAMVFVDEEKVESETMKSYNELSMRQLRKQLKAMTLKSLNSNEEKTARRPALQAICENKLVGGETTKLE